MSIMKSLFDKIVSSVAAVNLASLNLDPKQRQIALLYSKADLLNVSGNYIEVINPLHISRSRYTLESK